MMDTIASLADNGFMKFCILNAHGGNSQGISVLLQRCARHHHPAVATLPPSPTGGPIIHRLMERYGDTGREFYSRFAWADNAKLDTVRTKGGGGSGHAGETETSMILALRAQHLPCPA